MVDEIPEIETTEEVCTPEMVADALGVVDGWPPSLSTAPEVYRNLILGVVAKAVSDFVRYRYASKKELRREAKTAAIWLFGKVSDPLDDVPIGSFAWVCAVLGRDPSVARSRFTCLTVKDLPKTDRKKDR